MTMNCIEGGKGERVGGAQVYRLSESGESGLRTRNFAAVSRIFPDSPCTARRPASTIPPTLSMPQGSCKDLHVQRQYRGARHAHAGRRRGGSRGARSPGRVPRRQRHQRHRRGRHDRRVADAERRRAHRRRAQSGTARRQADSGHRRHRRELDAGSHRADAARQGRGRGRLPDGHAVLQQADAGRPVSALQGDRRARRRPDRPVQRAGPDRLRPQAGNGRAAGRRIPEHRRHQGSRLARTQSRALRPRRRAHGAAERRRRPGVRDVYWPVSRA